MNEPQESPPVVRSSRRRLLAGAGSVALLAGVGAAWWSSRSRAPQDAAVAAFWALSSTQPDGSPLSMRSFEGRPVLVNFWATWCPPCVEELPMIEAFYRQHTANGWQVVGLAVDKAPAVRTFLTKTAVTFPIGIVGMEGTSLLRSLGNAGGSLPFSLVLNSAGQAHARKMGQITLDDLQGWARGISNS